MEGKRRGYVYECRRCKYTGSKAYAEWHFLRKHIPLSQQPYHCCLCRMALRKKDIAGHLGTQIHRNHVSKHPNGPGGDPARFVISADRPHIVTASNKDEDDTDLLVWCKEKSKDKWRKAKNNTVAPDVFSTLEERCSNDQQRELLEGLRAMMGQIPETDDSNKMEVETEVETEMMSEDDEVASAVQGLLQAEQLVPPVSVTPLHQVLVGKVQEELRKPENEENTREIFVAGKDVASKGLEDLGERKEQGNGSTVKRKEEQEQRVLKRKLEAGDNEGAKRKKVEEPPKDESRKVQSATDKENRPPEQSKKRVTREEQGAGHDKDKRKQEQKEGRTVDEEDLLEHNFEPDYDEEEPPPSEAPSVAPSVAPVVGRMLRDCLETMVTSLKKVTSNDPLETAMVGVMNHLSTTNQNLGNLATSIESNQNKNKDHDIWASRIRMDTEELTRAVSSLKTEVRGVADSNRAIVESLNSFNSSVKSMFEKMSMLTQQAIEGYATVSAKLGEHSTILKNIQDKSDEPPKKKPEKENRLGYNSRDSPYEMREFEAHWDRVTEEEESRRSYQRHQERRHHSQHRRPRYDKR